MATIEPTKDNFEQAVTGSGMVVVAIRAALLLTPPPVRGAASERRSLWGNPA